MKSPIIFRLIVGALVAIVIGFATLSFQVSESEHAVLTRFGNPIRVVTKAGLYGRAPWPFESVQRFDARLDFYEIRLSEALTSDKRNVIIPVYVAWRISDPLKFLQSVGDAENARRKFDALVTSARNAVLGNYEFRQLVTTDSAQLRIPEMEGKITELVRAQAQETFGVAIEQVGMKRLSLPEANTEFVFRRMRAERAQFAARYRAEGKQQADELRAQTDAERSGIVADARKYAEETRGTAEAEAARIYSEAHGKDPEFYSFLRELEVLRQVVGKNTTLVLDTDSQPFRQLKGEPGAAAEAPFKVARP